MIQYFKKDFSFLFRLSNRKDRAFKCLECEFTADKKSQLLQHQRSANYWRNFKCEVCGASFTRKAHFDRHMEKHNDTNNIHCPVCNRAFGRPNNLQRHLREKHQIGGGQKRPSSEFREGRVTKQLKKDDDPCQHYDLQKVKEQRIEKFKTTASTYKVTFKDIEISDNILSTLKKLFSALFSDLTRKSKPIDLVRITVQSPSLDYTIVIPFLKVTELTADRFMSEVERVLQSNEDFIIDSGLIIDVTLVDMPSGGIGKRCKYVNMHKFLQQKKCILQIQNDDELCCARAIVTAKANIDKHAKWNSIRQGREIQKQLAKQLHAEAGVPLEKCSIEEVKMFQCVLSDYQLHVMSREHFNAIIYSGPEAEKKIFLYLHDDHFDIITSMPAFLSRNYFCIKCSRGYDHKEDHKCNNVCHCCRKVHDSSQEDWIQCDRCCRFFLGNECFDLHKRTTAKGKSTCNTIYQCKDCGKTVNRKLDLNHRCGQTFCKHCEDFF